MLSREVQRWPGARVRFCSPLTVGLWAGQRHPSLIPSLLLCQGGSRMAPTSRDSCEGSTTRPRSVCGRMPGSAGLESFQSCSTDQETRDQRTRGPSRPSGCGWPPRASVSGLGLHGMDGRTGVYREKRLWERGGAVGSLLSWFQQMMGTLVRRGCPPEAGQIASELVTMCWASLSGSDGPTPSDPPGEFNFLIFFKA